MWRHLKHQLEPTKISFMLVISLNIYNWDMQKYTIICQFYHLQYMLTIDYSMSKNVLGETRNEHRLVVSNSILVHLNHVYLAGLAEIYNNYKQT
jgi:hypothetical protein